MRELLVKSTISIIEKKRKSGGKFQYSQKREKLRIVKDFQKKNFCLFINFHWRDRDLNDENDENDEKLKYYLRSMTNKIKLMKH